MLVVGTSPCQAGPLRRESGKPLEPRRIRSGRKPDAGNTWGGDMGAMTSKGPSWLASSWDAYAGVALLSGLINVLYLSGSIFMLEVYDRVLPSRSIPTLIGLAAITAALYAFQGLFDLCRGRILSRIGATLDRELSQDVFQAVLRQPLRSRIDGDGQQPLRDLDQMKAFLASGGPAALFDLPWMPLYLAVCFAFHAWIGLAALGGALFLVAVTLLTDMLTRHATRSAVGAAAIRSRITESGRRNAEVVRALGMARRIGARWDDANSRHMTFQQRASDVSGGFGALTKVTRMLLQSAILGIGAYLVIDGQATGGIMIASSILTSRALAPVELAIANWRGFVGARQGWRRLQQVMGTEAAPGGRLKLPAPRLSLSVENAAVVAPGQGRLLVQEISFALKAGQGVGVIGPSGSGKSSLARLLVGIWPVCRGKIRLDGAALEHWPDEDLGGYLGYLPQDVELFAGTVTENIARFDPAADPEHVIAAAKAANVHDLILRLPDGYETEIGDSGAALSAGQRQRIGLARALFRDPFLIVLDEPNSNLDAEGDTALTQAILGVRARGGIVVVVAHRPSALAGVDMILMMDGGRAQAFGPKDEVLSRVTRPVPLPAAAVLKAVEN